MLAAPVVLVIFAVCDTSAVTIVPRRSTVVFHAIQHFRHPPSLYVVSQFFSFPVLQRNVAEAGALHTHDAQSIWVWSFDYDEAVDVVVGALVARDGRYTEVLAELVILEQQCHEVSVHRVVDPVAAVTSTADADAQLIVHVDRGQLSLTA